MSGIGKIRSAVIRALGGYTERGFLPSDVNPFPQLPQNDRIKFENFKASTELSAVRHFNRDGVDVMRIQMQLQDQIIHALDLKGYIKYDKKRTDRGDVYEATIWVGKKEVRE